MDASVKYIEEAYDEAISYAKEQMDKCDELSSRQKVVKSADKIMFKVARNAIIRIVIGIVALMYKKDVFVFLDKNVFAFLLKNFNIKYKFDMLKEWIVTAYFWGFIALLVCGILTFIRFIFMVIDRGDASGMDKIKKSIQKEIDCVKETKSALIKAISNNESVNICNSHNWDSKIIALSNKLDNASKNTRIRNQIISTIVCVVTSIISAVVLYPFIIKCYQVKFSYNALLELLLSYGILLIVISEVSVYLSQWYKKYTKGIIAGAFILYQGLIIKQVTKYKIFVPIITKKSDMLKKAPKFILTVYDFLNKYILIRGAILIALTTIVVLLYIRYTNMEREVNALTNGFIIPMQGASDRTLSYKQVRNSTGKTYLIGVLFMIVAPFLTYGVIAKELSVVGVLLYLGVGLVWLWVMGMMNNESNKAVLGEKISCVQWGIFIGYILLTLSLIPKFGIGSILLIAFQSIIATVIGFFALAMFN